MTSPIKTPYEDLLREVLAHGRARADRTGTGTIGVFGRQIRFDMADGFPLITTKKVFTRGIIAELLWFLDGDTNEHSLRDQGVNIWREWAGEDGDLGPVYGAQWRSWGAHGDAGLWHGVDQIQALMEGLRRDPFGRRHIVSAWNVEEIPDMALPPCHTMFQFYVHPDANGDPAVLDLQLYQRSADLFLGVPFNIASYALLLHMVAAQLGLVAGEFVHTFGDAHIYLNHVEQVELQLSRQPRRSPNLFIAPAADLFSYTPQHFDFQVYDPHPAIKGEVSV